MLKIGKKLTSKGRKHIAPSNFAIPERKAYPIHDISHARNALARVAQYGSPEEQKRVRAAVYRKYPSLNKDKKASAESLKRAAINGILIKYFGEVPAKLAGKTQRGVPDGTGPAKGSLQDRTVGIGKNMQAGLPPKNPEAHKNLNDKELTPEQIEVIKKVLASLKEE